MTDPVVLLKHGKPVSYRRCSVCDHYTRWISFRGWCEQCEREFASLKKQDTSSGEHP